MTGAAVHRKEQTEYTDLTLGNCTRGDETTVRQRGKRTMLLFRLLSRGLREKENFVSNERATCRKALPFRSLLLFFFWVYFQLLIWFVFRDFCLVLH